jgi:hypothetical protein
VCGVFLCKRNWRTKNVQYSCRACSNLLELALVRISDSVTRRIVRDADWLTTDICVRTLLHRCVMMVDTLNVTVRVVRRLRYWHRRSETNSVIDGHHVRVKLIRKASVGVLEQLAGNYFGRLVNLMMLVVVTILRIGHFGRMLVRYHVLVRGLELV